MDGLGCEESNRNPFGWGRTSNGQPCFMKGDSVRWSFFMGGCRSERLGPGMDRWSDDRRNVYQVGSREDHARSHEKHRTASIGPESGFGTGTGKVSWCLLRYFFGATLRANSELWRAPRGATLRAELSGRRKRKESRCASHGFASESSVGLPSLWGNQSPKSVGPGEGEGSC